MRMVKNIFIGLVLGWLMLLAFMPKQELYYKLEQALEKNDIIINEKRLESGIFSLTLYDADIYVKGINLAHVDEVDFFTLLAYTKIDIDGLSLDDSLKNMLPTKIEKTLLTHKVWKPMQVDIYTNGSFGSAEGTIDLKTRSVRLDFNDTTAIETLKPNLHEDEKGWYYETSF